MGGTIFHLSCASTWPDSASCNVCCRGACAKRLFCSRVLAAAKEEIDVEKSRDRRGNHEVTCFRSDFDCVFVRLGQVRASKQRSRDQCRGPEIGPAPE